MAGKFYSISRVITRSATAAGQAVIADLESIRRDQDPERARCPGLDLAAPDPAGRVAYTDRRVAVHAEEPGPGRH